MNTYIALLRGVNVAGHKPVAMADLRSLAARLGLSDARTLLQSGNLVFRASRRAGAPLERALEAEAEKILGLHTVFFVRTCEEWKTAIDLNPFPEEARRDPGHLLLTVLKKAPDAGQVEALQAAIVGRERVRAIGSQAYIVYPDGVGRSRLTSALIEKHLGTRATARNWNTVRKLGALASADVVPG